jgi:acyl-coenzyme A thioesterase PaaI-like protein
MTVAQRLVRRIGFARFLRILRAWPPFLGAGIRIREAAEDASRVTVELPLHALNRNFVGTHFGGSLYAMCDPFFMLMLLERLGPGFVVWDKSARIDFLRPGRGTVRATFELPAERVEAIRREALDGGRAAPEFEVTVVGADGELVARIGKTLSVRPSERRLSPAAGATPAP